MLCTVAEISLGVFLVLFGVAAETYYVLVNTQEGPILGKVVDFEDQEITNVSVKINVFQGIPYAEKPVRFAKSVPKERWTEILYATEYTASCPQHVDSAFHIINPQGYSEDCLALNVFAPNQTEQKLPVMVYIHGGGYQTGTSMLLGYYGVPMAAIGQVVVVTINYRLGALGFLSTGDEAAPGNFGLMDQALALQWVRRNIEGFGGNSSMVTIFGVSAGASSVDLHVLSKYSHGLFDQAIMQSGQAVAFWAFDEEQEKKKRQNAFHLGKLVDCNTMDSTELVECLRDIDAMALEETLNMNQIHVGPTIDGDFINDYPREITERGEFKHCPMIIGFNRDEGTFSLLLDLPAYYLDQEPPFLNEEVFDTLVPKSLMRLSGYTADLLEDSVKHEYVDWSSADQPDYNYLRSIANIGTDIWFGCPAIQTARAHAMMTSEPIYLYQFSHVPTRSIFRLNEIGPGWLGASHGEEIPFLFGYGYIPEVEAVYGTLSEEEKHFSVKMMKYWTHFAWTGHPSPVAIDRNVMEKMETNGANIGFERASNGNAGTMDRNITMEMIHDQAWLPFDVPGLLYKELAISSHIKKGLKSRECAFWDTLRPKLQRYLESMDDAELEWREEFHEWKADLESWRTAFHEYMKSPQCEDE